MKRQYITSERAHFMCPDMHFGMLMEVEKAYEPEAVKATLERMALAHPFLKSLIAYEEESSRLYYCMTGNSQIDLYIREDSASLWTNYQAIGEQDWNVFENGMLKVYVYPQAQGMKLLFVAHHLLTDGRGLLSLAQEFARDYVKGIAPDYAEEVLIESIHDLPEKSALSGISKWLVQSANKQWKKENHAVDYAQYSRFVKTYSQSRSIKYDTYEVSGDAYAQMTALCKENGFSMNDLLMAQMYLKTGAEKIIIAADIRKTLPKYVEGSMGNYSTAMGIHFKAKDKDIVKTAKAVRAQVQKSLKNNRTLMLVLACYFDMVPELLDAAAITALGGFESKAALFVGDRMFGFKQPKSYSITNLGKVENPSIKSLMFIPPASPASILCLGVVTLNGVMRGCSSKRV